MGRHASDATASAKAQLLFEGQKQLDGSLETQRPGGNARTCRRSRHQRTHQIVGQQVDGDFLVDHRRRLGAQNIHAHVGLDRAQINLHLPAPVVELVELGCTDELWVGEGRDQDAAGDLGFAIKTGSDTIFYGAMFKRPTDHGRSLGSKVNARTISILTSPILGWAGLITMFSASGMTADGTIRPSRLPVVRN